MRVKIPGVLLARNWPSWRGRPLLLDPKQSSVQPVAEALRQFDRLFVAQQLHNIFHAVVDSSAVPASFKMVLDPDSQLRREIALEIVRQFLAYLIAIDFYGP